MGAYVPMASVKLMVQIYYNFSLLGIVWGRGTPKSVKFKILKEVSWDKRCVRLSVAWGGKSLRE